MNRQRRVRLCLRDLYHQDIVEMIERETKPFSIWSIESADDPDFDAAFDLLWHAFGAAGEMESKDVIAGWLDKDQNEVSANGTFMRYFLLVAKDREGRVRGARDGAILLNPAYQKDLCVIYLSHIYMIPEARGTVLSYWLRTAPVELAVQYLSDLQSRGLIELPDPGAPGRYFGMKLDLVAEMEYFAPEDRISWKRILFYGRGGFDALHPRHCPFQQPDFRDPALIEATGITCVPFMLLMRRLGRERQAHVPIAEVEAAVRMMRDDHATFCSAESMEASYHLVLDRLAGRAKIKPYVSLVRLPTGAHNLARLRRLFRYDIYTRYYADAPATHQYLESGIREKLEDNPRYVADAIERIRAELSARPTWVYGNRSQAFTWSGQPIHPDDLRDSQDGDSVEDFTDRLNEDVSLG